MEKYRFLIHNQAYQKARAYFNELGSKKLSAGSYFERLIQAYDLNSLNTEEMLEKLVQTKKPQIFAESQVRGDGTDWNLHELSILGNTLAAVPVKVFDNGQHQNPFIFDQPFDATLIYLPGALLRNDMGLEPADWKLTTRDGKLHAPGYYYLYKTRLLPAFFYANQQAGKKGNKALITIPGLGCGQFAGKFKGQLGKLLGDVIGNLLVRYQAFLPNIRAVYYDPFGEGESGRYEIGSLSYLVRPYRKVRLPKTQLNPARVYAEIEGDDFFNLELFSLVAWDHVSWPGNDFYGGSRTTDDGVKAAASSSMQTLTGFEGEYHPHTNTYDPPAAYHTWGELVKKENCRLKLAGNLSILPEEEPAFN